MNGNRHKLQNDAYLGCGMDNRSAWRLPVRTLGSVQVYRGDMNETTKTRSPRTKESICGTSSCRRPDDT